MMAELGLEPGLHRVHTEQRVREESLKSKRCEQRGHIHGGPESRPGCSAGHTPCWALSASRCVCLTCLIFCKHLEDRELSMLLFHVHHHTQHRARGSIEPKPPLAAHAGPHRLSHLAHQLSGQQKSGWPRVMRSCQLPPFSWEDNTRSPHRLTRQKRKPLCRLNPAIVF